MKKRALAGSMNCAKGQPGGHDDGGDGDVRDDDDDDYVRDEAKDTHARLFPDQVGVIFVKVSFCYF